MKTIESILNSVSDTIYKRGEDYYRSGKILHIEREKDGSISAEVEGSSGEDYFVHIEMNKSGNIEYFDCDCPYDYSPVCKHIVAVMLAIQNDDFSNYDENNISISDKLKSLSKEEIIDILSSFAESDYKLKEKLNNKLNRMLNKNYDISEIVDSIIDAYSDRNGFVDYYSCYDMCMEIVGVINDEFEYFIRDNSLTHIQYLMYINRRLIDVMDYCDDSDGGISIALDETEEKLYNMCMTIYNSAVEEDCTACLNMLCNEAKNKSYNYWLESRISLLNIAVQFSEYNTQLVSKAIDGLINLCRNDYEYGFENAILIKYEFLVKTQSQKKADGFLYNYIDCNRVCEYLVKRYIEEEKFKEAEQLCINKLKKGENKKFWNNLLALIYESSKQLDKQLSIELELLMNGDSRKYDTVKKLMLKLGLWEKSYSDLIEKLSNKLSPHFYAVILDTEGEYKRLLDLVKKYNYLLNPYFKTLTKKYPDEANDMYYDYILETAKTTSSRKEYKSVCREITELYNEGGKEHAKRLIDLLKSNFRRKRAFQDELNKVSKKFKL